MGMPYWIYGRINVHVGRTDDEVREALQEWADTALKQGRAFLATPEGQTLVNAVVKEHHDAQQLYAVVTGGI
jgi:hypothetical protein